MLAHVHIHSQTNTHILPMQSVMVRMYADNGKILFGQDLNIVYARINEIAKTASIHLQARMARCYDSTPAEQMSDLRDDADDALPPLPPKPITEEAD